MRCEYCKSHPLVAQQSCKNPGRLTNNNAYFNGTSNVKLLVVRDQSASLSNFAAASAFKNKEHLPTRLLLQWLLISMMRKN